jgi:hypothetical protein
MTPGPQKLCHRGELKIVLSLAFLSGILSLSASAAFSQSGTNNTGNGGRHTIQGRIFGDSGRRTLAQGLKVTLQSLGLGDLTVFVDSNGTFAFRNLVPGSYLVVIDGGMHLRPLGNRPI